MAKRIAKIKRSALKKVFAVFSFTTALFVFQACYGTPQGYYNELHIEGLVKSATSGNPILNIQVQLAINNGDFKVYTDSSGAFSIGADRQEILELSISDIDAEANGSYAPKDTIITPAMDSNHVFIEILLDEL